MPIWCSDNGNTNDVMPCQSYMAGMEHKPQRHHADLVHIICAA